MAKMILRADDGQETEFDPKVLRLGPNDRLMVRADMSGGLPSREVKSITDTVARWAGIDESRVLFVYAEEIDILVLRPDEAVPA